MKFTIASLLLLSVISWAETEYMKNDGVSAPETLDRAAEEGQRNAQIQREEAEEVVTPPGNAQEMREEEAEQVDDNYLIGPYNGKGEYTFPNEDEKQQREELREEQREKRRKEKSE